MFKTIKEFFLFIFNDFKTDIQFLYKAFTGKISDEYIKERNKKLVQAFKPIELLKEYWLFFLVVILAFCVGWFIASQYYQAQVNQYLIDNCMNFTGIKYGDGYKAANAIKNFTYTMP